MSEPERAMSENLVEVHKARDVAEGTMVASLLRDNGIKAAFQGDRNITLDMAEMLRNTDDAFGVYVLERNAPRAKELIQEFFAAAPEAQSEQAAAQVPRLDRERIHELRGQIKEERRTFEFLGWVVVAFLASAALLWAIWPAWLKMEAPSTGLRWAMVILLGLGALFAGSWAGKKL